MSTKGLYQGLLSFYLFNSPLLRILLVCYLVPLTFSYFLPIDWLYGLLVGYAVSVLVVGGVFATLQYLTGQEKISWLKILKLSIFWPKSLLLLRDPLDLYIELGMN